ncbi:hypothetical protein BASA83_009165 [Batrachochytrium salamandrivorans]|nr:hypothetical protein BASA83_009165 [Batrachochytrium salamandrivorans]
MNFPRWTFPFNSEPIGFGTLSGVGMDMPFRPTTEGSKSTALNEREGSASQANSSASIAELRHLMFIQDNNKKSYYPLSRIVKTLPRTHIWEPPIIPPRVPNQIGSMMAYYDGNYYSSHIPNNLLKDHLSDHFDSIFNDYQFDLFSGNRLHSWQSPDHRDSWLVYPTGLLGNTFCINKLSNEHELVHTVNSNNQADVLEVLDTPILQITSSTTSLPASSHSAQSNSNDFLGIRSFQGVHFFKLGFTDEGRIDTGLIQQFPLSPQALDLNFNKIIPGHAALIQSNGALHIWDARYTGLTTWRKKDSERNMTDSVLSNQACWKSCQFGAHPRTLLVAHSKLVEICDLRAPASSSDVVVFNGIGPNETISGMDQNPLHTFEIALATSERTVIIDTRYKKYPLLHWGLNTPLETRFHISYLSNLCNRSFDSVDTMQSKYTVATWGQVQGEILLYDYQSSGNNPPTSSCIQKLASFSTHPDVLRPSLSTMPCVTPNNNMNLHRRLKLSITPPWAPLIGVQAVANPKTNGFTLLQLASDGALYAQAYSMGSVPGANGTYESGRPIYDDENVIVTALDALEDEVLNAEIACLGRMKLPTGSLKSHKLVNMSCLPRVTNQMINDQIVGDSLKIRDLTPNILLSNTIQNVQDIFETQKDPKRDKSAETLLPTRTTVAEFLKNLDTLLNDPKNAHEYADTLIVEPGQGFIPFNSEPPPCSLNEVKTTIMSLLECDGTYVADGGDESLFISDKVGIRLLSRDIWFTRKTIIPSQTVTEMDLKSTDTHAMDDSKVYSKQSKPMESAFSSDNDDGDIYQTSAATRDIPSQWQTLNRPAFRSRLSGVSVGSFASSMMGNASQYSVVDNPSHLLRSVDTGNPIINSPAILHTPVCPNPVPISGTISTFMDMWDHPEKYYDPNAQSKNFRHGKKRFIADRRKLKRRLASRASLAASEAGTSVAGGVTPRHQSHTQQWVAQQLDMMDPNDDNGVGLLKRAVSQPVVPTILSRVGNSTSPWTQSMSQHTPTHRSVQADTPVAGRLSFAASGMDQVTPFGMARQGIRSVSQMDHPRSSLSGSLLNGSAKKPKKPRTKGF